MADPQVVREKWLLKSKTFWGGVIGFAPVLVQTFGGGDISDIGLWSDAGWTFIDAINEIVGVALLIWARYGDGGQQAARLTLRRT